MSVGSWSGFDEVIKIAGKSSTIGESQNRYFAHTGINVSLSLSLFFLFNYRAYTQ